MTTKKPVILITGATATGKTGLGIKLAKTLEKEAITAEIINGDSLLFYQELSIGTAKPTVEEQQNIPHHLVGHQSIRNPLNASDFCNQALPLINKLHQENKIPILVGGSAFYLRALMIGMYESGETDPAAVTKLEELEELSGWQGIRELLKKEDPISFEKIHENDRYRTLRALEYFLTHNSPISKERKRVEESGPYDFTKLRDSNWCLHHIYLEIPKDDHWPIMEMRARKMLDDGLLEEVKDVLAQGHSKDLKPLQSIGYKETIEYLENEESDLGPLIEKIYINTRRLAKSQKTFFKKIAPKLTYNPLLEGEKIEHDFLSFLKIL